MGIDKAKFHKDLVIKVTYDRKSNLQCNSVYIRIILGTFIVKLIYI